MRNFVQISLLLLTLQSAINWAYQNVHMWYLPKNNSFSVYNMSNSYIISSHSWSFNWVGICLLICETCPSLSNIVKTSLYVLIEKYDRDLFTILVVVGWPTAAHCYRKQGSLEDGAILRPQKYFVIVLYSRKKTQTWKLFEIPSNLLPSIM